MKPGWLLYGIVAIGFANFFAFAAVAIVKGGDALNGYTANGLYFVGEHGRFTQVTKAFFMYSQWHAYSVFVTHPAAMIAAAMTRRKPKIATG